MEFMKWGLMLVGSNGVGFYLISRMGMVLER